MAWSIFRRSIIRQVPAGRGPTKWRPSTNVRQTTGAKHRHLADASIMPSIVIGDTNPPTIMIDDQTGEFGFEDRTR